MPCEDPNHQYIGQTKRRLIIRRNEHEKSCLGDLTNIQPDQTLDNGLAYHHATTGHEFMFDDTKIIDSESNGLKRKILEGIHILKNRDSAVNLNSGLKIDSCWAPILMELP